MKKQFNYKNGILLFLCMFSILFLTKNVKAAESIIMEVPVALEITGATGIDINIRLNPELVETAEVYNKSEAISQALIYGKQTEDKLKVAIASSKEITSEGDLFTLKLTVKKAVTSEDELFKVLQVRVNEKTVFKADNCILVTGVSDGEAYRNPVTITFNEGTATLNGKAFENNSTVSEEGEYLLQITDLKGNTRTIWFRVVNLKEFIIDSIAPSKVGLAGGDTVTVSGENFRTDMTAKLNGKVIDYTFISDKEIQFNAPSGELGKVDFQLLNVYWEATTVTNGITYYDKESNIEVIETEKENGLFKLPIKAVCNGAADSINLKIRADRSFFYAAEFEVQNNSPDMTSRIEYSSDGTITLTISSTSTLKTDGVIGYLVLTPKEVTAAISTTIELIAGQFNGIDSSKLVDCTVTLEPNFTVSGTIRYYSDNSPITGVSINSNVGYTYTDEFGMFMLSNIKQNLVTITPRLNGYRHNVVTAQDAAMVLKAIVDTQELSEYQKLAADVNRDGSVNAMDASYILQKAVGIIYGTFPGGEEWIFTPDTKELTLTGNVNNADFIGIVLGDVTGNAQAEDEDNLE